jgi:hypothetical protein
MRRVMKSELKSEYQTIEPQLKKYLAKYPDYDLHKMLQEVLLGETILWAGDESFVIGGPVQYHNSDVFLLECAAGSLEEIIEAWDVIEAEVKAWGFQTMEICGRFGWKKMMEPKGFKAERVILRKTIGEEDGR